MHFLAQADGSVPTPRDAASTSAVTQATTTQRATSSVSTKPKVAATSSSSTSTPATSTPITLISPSTTPVTTSAYGSFVLPIALGVGVLAVGAWFVIQRSKSKDEKKDPKERCDDIKSLIETKKRELAEMAKDWSKDKLVVKSQEKIVQALKKHEKLGHAAAVSLEAKAKYEKLKETIEILEKRYDLCLLSLPGAGDFDYEGVIIENSLRDKEALKYLHITKTKREGNWTIHEVSATKEEIKKLPSFIAGGPWYMHFRQKSGSKGVVVFREGIFPVDFSQEPTLSQAREYGKSIGIPEAQLDFKSFL